MGTLAVGGVGEEEALREIEDSPQARVVPAIGAYRGKKCRRRAAKLREKESLSRRNVRGEREALGFSACRRAVQRRAFPACGARGPSELIAARSTSCSPSKADRDCRSFHPGGAMRFGASLPTGTTTSADSPPADARSCRWPPLAAGGQSLATQNLARVVSKNVRPRPVSSGTWLIAPPVPPALSAGE